MWQISVNLISVSATALVNELWTRSQPVRENIGWSIRNVFLTHLAWCYVHVQCLLILPYVMSSKICSCATDSDLNIFYWLDILCDEICSLSGIDIFFSWMIHDAVFKLFSSDIFFWHFLFWCYAAYMGKSDCLMHVICNVFYVLIVIPCIVSLQVDKARELTRCLCIFFLSCVSHPSLDLLICLQQATGLGAWASRVKCPARFVSHLHDICIYMSCL